MQSLHKKKVVHSLKKVNQTNIFKENERAAGAILIGLYLEYSPFFNINNENIFCPITQTQIAIKHSK